jgi:glycosyltransferase involved in cell wall biosynthesis
LNNVRAVLASCSTKNDTNRIFIKEFFKKIIVSCFHGAFVGGDNSKNYALSLGIPKKEIVTGLQCVDNNWFIKPKFNNKSKKVTLEKTKKILFVGRLIPKKNLERIIDAVYEIETLVKKIKYCIIIVGAGPLESNLKQKVATYKIENRVEFAGWVPKVRIREYYSKADLLILPSYSEPWLPGCQLQSQINVVVPRI